MTKKYRMTTQKIKYTRKDGCLPSYELYGYRYGIGWYRGDCYWENKSNRIERYALVKHLINNPEEVFYFDDAGQLVIFENEVCPNGETVLRHNNQSLLTNGVIELVVEELQTTYIPDSEKLQARKRHRVITDWDTIGTGKYKVIKRQARQIIEEGFCDLEDAMEFAQEYLQSILEETEKQLMPELPF